MRIQSAKAKGRRLCAELKVLIHKIAPWLRDGDVEVTSSSAPGEDIKLSPAARDVLPVVVECKNVESLNVWKAFAQAESHARNKPHLTPVLFFRRNRSPMMCALLAEDFLRLVIKPNQIREENLLRSRDE